MIQHRFKTPLGEMLALLSGDGLRWLHFTDQDGNGQNVPHPATRSNRGCHNCLTALELQLDEYFHAQRQTFNLPLDMIGTTFQLAVWKALLEIPYGETRNYAELGKQVGLSKNARATGHANARNPLAIIIPCHRVIGSDGNLRGYAGGVWRKQALLDLEKSASNHT